jgi:nickel-dependent lactate racemase
MQYSLAYGREQLTVELPEKNVVKVLKIQTTDALEDPLDAVFDVLEEPIESEPLAAIAEGKKSACVVVCDSTRPVPNPEILPPILQTLEDSGIDLSKITILIATGLRRTSTMEERHEIIGEDIMLRKFKVSDHSARKLHQHEYLGVTKAGTPIWIDRRYLEAEVKILTGAIEPHSISGFSGGRQSICPGIAAIETVAPCYAPQLLEDENVRPGCVEGNPVHAEQMEIARKAGCDFIVNVILNQDRKIAKVIGGHLNQAFLEGISQARKRQTVTVEKQVDIVVTCGGGSPYDKTWHQTIHGIVGALDILKPGGTVIIASACEEGVGGGEDFEKMTESFATIDDFMSAIMADQTFAEQWQLQELAKVLQQGKVKVITSGVPAETLQKFFVVPCASVEEAVAEAMKEYGANASIAVIPQGRSVLAVAKQKEPAVVRETKRFEPKKVETKVAEPKKTAVESVEAEPESKAVKKTATKKAVTKKAVAKKTATKSAEPKETEPKKAPAKKVAKKTTKKSG